MPDAEPTVTDYATELEALTDNELAWLAARLAGRRTWPTREAAISAIVEAHEGMPEDDPREGLLRRSLRKPKGVEAFA